MGLCASYISHSVTGNNDGVVGASTGGLDSSMDAKTGVTAYQ